MSRPGLTRRKLIGLAGIGAGAFALGQYLRQGQPLGTDISELLDVSALASAPGYPSEGPSDAPVTALVFSDYACGVCRRTEPAWREAVAEAGDTRVVYRDWPILGEPSRQAARAALAADRQGVHAAFHRALIRSGRLTESGIRAALAEAGGDWARLQSDLGKHGAEIDALLARTARDAFQLALRGTPAFLVGPIRIEGGASIRQFAEAISRASARQAPSSRRNFARPARRADPWEHDARLLPAGPARPAAQRPLHATVPP